MNEKGKASTRPRKTVKAKVSTKDDNQQHTNGGGQTAQGIARDYLTRGWHPVAIPFKQKAPTGKDWHKRTITLENFEKYFHGQMNIGVQMGQKSGGLADGDLDCEEALALASYFLPPTDAIFGRASKPKAHWLYYCDDPEPKAAMQFKDDQGGMIIELRLGAEDRGAQTIFPGSVHPSGEAIEWDETGEPVRVNYGALKAAACKVACAVLLLRNWPQKGSRHTAALILGSFLARAGWSIDAIDNFVRAVTTEAGDDEVADRVSAARDSFHTLVSGDKRVAGLPKLRELIGDAVANLIAKYLEYSDPDEEIDELNKTFAVVRVRGQVAILEETTTTEGYSDFCLMSVDHFSMWKANEFKTLIVADKPKRIPLPKYWLQHQRRRQFLGLVFRPGQDTPGYYNLWHGFAVAPKPGDCSKFLAHVQDNICSGNAEHFKWIMGWCADIVQHPTQKKGTSLVLRGKQGVGKTKFGEVIGSTLGSHYFPATSPRYITGQFNSHLVTCLLLHADEGFWAGDRAAEGKLKDLITGSSHPIEFKHREPYLVDNHVRLLVTGNEDWQVPATLEDRRFAVFDVADSHMKDYPYFAAIDKEMEAGGREALLHYLMNFDLTSTNLRDTPKTDALLEQKVASFTAEQQWWLDVLHRGELPLLFEECKCSTSALHQSYIHRTMQTGARRRAMETRLGMFLKGAVGPELKRVQHKSAGFYSYTFPPLKECRRRWETKMQTTIRWDDPAAVWRKETITM